MVGGAVLAGATLAGTTPTTAAPATVTVAYAQPALGLAHTVQPLTRPR